MSVTNPLDFNTAETNNFEVIPDGETVHLILKFIAGDPADDLHATKDGTGRLMKAELVVTEGKYAKRKLFLNQMLATTRRGAEAEGHQKAIDISRSLLRSIVEAARGVSPTDETPKAVEARKLNAIADLDQMEFWAVVGVDSSPGYADKNVIKRVLPAGKGPGEKAYDAKAESASMKSAAGKATTQKGW